MSKVKLRDYQQYIFQQVIDGTSNDLVQLDTGAGKTPTEAALAQWARLVIMIAHRNFLIAQISEKLAAFNHRLARIVRHSQRHRYFWRKWGHNTRRI
jgi:superfamily II DNA or RNA helicase